MRLLIVTQKVSKNDPILGFFHPWISEFAKHFESVIVICLEKGEYQLPENVRVLSLGKERYGSDYHHLSARFAYARTFLSYVWRERNNYDAVFVHMNQEYVLLAGWLWRMMGKKVTMWRNHHAGNIFTDIAASFCDTIFCTSKYSFTAKYKNTLIMPVGIDTDLFSAVPRLPRVPHSILFLGRMSPVKKSDLLLKALVLLKGRGVSFTASFYGDPIPADRDYYQSLVEKVHQAGMENVVAFRSAVPNYETPALYSTHTVCVNGSPSGMYDKTMFEAMACGCLILASNKYLAQDLDPRYIFEEGNASDLARKLEVLFDTESPDARRLLREYVISKHSLASLSSRLKSVIID